MSDRVAYVSLQQFCSFHGCEIVVIEEFIDHGIVEAILEDNHPAIPEWQVPRVERALRLYRELGVNPAGIDIILNLLDRLQGDLPNRVEEY